MIRRPYEILNLFYLKRTQFVCISIAVLVLFVDFITGSHIRFPALYVLPVAMAAWQSRRRLAYAMAFLMPFARIGFHHVWQTDDFVPVLINAPLTMLSLWYYAYLLYKMSLYKRGLEIKVNILEGILPICASCKKIRNEKGDFEVIEKYISEHSKASFSHTICPECGKKLYPYYYKDVDETSPKD